ncbi:hypothetical protein ZWY2020_044101 [Hordeum vulgare]|nr:hypothetical protein ZWY2020_044101 [Hordeum vulgare]
MVRDHGDGVMAIVGRIGMVGSIALNLAALVIYLRGSFFWSINTATKKQVSTKEKKVVVVAPSSGKPPVLCDSVVNLDHHFLLSVGTTVKK